MEPAMRQFAVFAFVSLLAQVAIAATPGLDDAWVVALSAEPGKPYTHPMQLTLHADGRVDGSFYGSTIEAGCWKEDRGRLCASFRTADGVGPYHSPVCLDGTTARGHTWAEHRNFLFNWNAKRLQS